MNIFVLQIQFPSPFPPVKASFCLEDAYTKRGSFPVIPKVTHLFIFSYMDIYDNNRASSTKIFC